MNQRLKGLIVMAAMVAMAGCMRVGRADTPADLVTIDRAIGESEGVARVVKDPTTSGIAAVFAMKGRFGSPQELVAFYEKVLPSVKDEAVVRAIRFELSELYRQLGDLEKSRGQLEMLVVGKK